MKERFDFTNLFKRASTWCALVTLAASSALGAYAIFPGRLQDLMPDWLLVTLGGLAMGAAFLTPFATSFQQKFTSKPPSTPE
jgi:hypothetical protein